MLWFFNVCSFISQFTCSNWILQSTPISWIQSLSWIKAVTEHVCSGYKNNVSILSLLMCQVTCTDFLFEVFVWGINTFVCLCVVPCTLTSAADSSRVKAWLGRGTFPSEVWTTQNCTVRCVLVVGNCKSVLLKKEKQSTLRYRRNSAMFLCSKLCSDLGNGCFIQKRRIWFNQNCFNSNLFLWAFFDIVLLNTVGWVFCVFSESRCPQHFRRN